MAGNCECDSDQCQDSRVSAGISTRFWKGILSCKWITLIASTNMSSGHVSMGVGEVNMCNQRSTYIWYVIITD